MSFMRLNAAGAREHDNKGKNDEPEEIKRREKKV